MSHPNIFKVIGEASSHIEIYHAAFLESMLKSDRRLVETFWQKATPPDWSHPKGRVTIKREDNLGRGTGRIDLTLLEGNPPHRVLGVEVKTQGTSTTAGQLERYHKGLTENYPTEKYPGRKHAIAFLTPFNRERAGDVADALPSVKEFDKFHAAFPNSVHLSWLDLAEIEWDGGELWDQHRTYIREIIASPKLLCDWKPGGRSRKLADFFGEEAAEEFFAKIHEVAGDHEGGKLDLRKVEEPAAFADAFRVLITSEKVRDSGRAKRETFTAAPPLDRFLKAPAPASEVHLAIFQLAAEYDNVWIQGSGNYGLRVVHPYYANSVGVSLLTSYKDENRVKIGKSR